VPEKLRAALACVAVAGGAGVVLPVAAQDFPTRALRLVVPYGPGGSTDTVARVLAARMAESTGQQVMVDNRGGGASIVGTEVVARAAPDGYTMLLGNIALGANPSLFRKLPYDAVRDFAPVALVATMPTVAVTHPSVPVRSVKQLIALARARPGEIDYASVGNGSINHLTAEVFRASTGTSMVHVVYKGAGPALVDLLGGRIPLMFATIVASHPHVEAGRLVALGVSGLDRSPALPQVPTIAESGVPGFDVKEWQLLVVPAGTPAATMQRLNAELLKALNVPTARERIVGLGAEPAGSTAAEAAAFLRAQTERWARTVREARIRPID